MNHRPWVVMSVALAVSTAVLSANVEFECAGLAHAAAPADSPDYRKYAPDRVVDIKHVLLEVTPNFQERSVGTVMTMTFKPIAKPADQLRLHAIDLRVQEVTSSEPIETHENTGEEIIVHFKNPLPADKEATIKIVSKAFPQKGMYFRTAEMGYKQQDEHLFTQGEDVEARHWFPIHDFPNEKFTSEILCRVPQDMIVLSNGRLVSDEVTDNQRVVRWLQDKPHVAYLISLVAGRFKKVEDRYKEIPLAFYVPTSDMDFAKNSFAPTKECMAFFEKEIGVPYPWAKYYQVCVQDFMWGGMENTSVTTLFDGTLFPDETENIRSSDSLVAHELAHQWFGDLVTCKDWSHLWLNEGFATYYALLHSRHTKGEDSFHYGLWQAAQGFVNRSASDDARPVVFRKYDTSHELFGYLVYPKGAWVLHMLRSQLGEDLFRRCVKTYLERHQFDTVVTADLLEVVEELSGRSYDQFFDQWLHFPHHPELQASYSWDQRARLAKVSISQVQPLTNEIALFNFPLTIRFKGAFGTRDHRVTVKAKQEDFFVPLPEAPRSVRLNPDQGVLAKISFDPPRPLVLEQLKDDSDVIGRILALQQLGKSRDPESVQAIKTRLNSDSFHGVRIEAAQALRNIHTPEALAALLSSTDQSDARVRQQVLIQLSNFRDPKVREHAMRVLEQEKNPDIVHHAILALGGSPNEEVRPALLRALESTSFRNIVAEGAVTAIRRQNNPAYVPDLLRILQNKQESFSSGAFARSLDTLAYLARHEENKDAVREFLVKQLDQKKSNIRVAAINALSTLQDSLAIGVLEKTSRGSKYLPETSAAERAVSSLRAGRKPVDEFNTIRAEIRDLKERNEELKKSLEDVKKRLEAQSASTPSPKPPEKKRPFLAPKARK